MAGWGGGLTALGEGLGQMSELMRQRKLDELRQQEQQKVDAERLAESTRQNEELKLRQRETTIRDQQAAQQASSNVISRAAQIPSDVPLGPDMVADLQRTGNGGMIRTVGAGQTALPSSRWQGDLYTKTQDPGAVEGMFRQMNPAERTLEDQQKQQKEIQAEAFRQTDRQKQADREAKATQDDLNRRAKEDQDIRDIEGRKDVARLMHAGNDANGRPYYQFMTNYDTQGRPVGVQVGNARTGELTPAPNAPILKPPPGDLGKQSIVNETALDQLDRLEEKFTATKSSVGPLTGRINSVKQQLPGVTPDKKYADLEAASNAFTNAVIKAITGAQMSETEATRIKKQIPLVTDKQEVWLSKAKMTRANLQDLENRLKTKRPVTGRKSAEELLKMYGDSDGR